MIFNLLNNFLNTKNSNNEDKSYSILFPDPFVDDLIFILLDPKRTFNQGYYFNWHFSSKTKLAEKQTSENESVVKESLASEKEFIKESSDLNEENFMLMMLFNYQIINLC